MQNWKGKLRARRKPQGRSGPVKDILGHTAIVPLKDAAAAQLRHGWVLSDHLKRVLNDLATEATTRRLGPEKNCVTPESREGWRVQHYHALNFAYAVVDAVLAEAITEPVETGVAIDDGSS